MSKPEYQERLEAIYTAFEKGGADQKTVDDLVALSKETVAVKKAEDAQRRAAAEAAALGGSTQAVPVDMGARYYYRPYGSYGYGGHIHPPK